MKNRRNIVEQKYPPENPNDLWMKDDVLYKSTYKGWTPLTAGSGSSINGVISTTWKELKDKRDAGKLIPGSLYRITDYNCTTTQENTRSAGHQFDIVLLALSENKLAERGWATHHEGDTYFADCNLAAWQVWYCLDNDTNRFAWADDSVDEGSPASISFIFDGAVFNCFRHTDGDGGENHPFGWITEDKAVVFTDTQIPNIGDNVYDGPGSLGQVISTVSNYSPTRESTGLPNGRGMIYRLIDEWNNDCPYDFKNIQLYLPIVDGEYVGDGQKIWVYTFCLHKSDDGTYEDGSLKRIEVSVDDTYTVFSNNIMVPDLLVNRYFRIPFNLLLGYYSIENEDAYSPTECNFFNCNYAIVQHASNVYLYNCKMRNYVVEVGGIYYNTKKVLTES